MLLYLHTDINKVRKMRIENKSIRGRIKDLQPGGKIYFVGAHEGTIRCTASAIANLAGRRYAVRKTDDKIMVYRYE